jgi:hypothetical protein
LNTYIKKNIIAEKYIMPIITTIAEFPYWSPMQKRTFLKSQMPEFSIVRDGITGFTFNFRKPGLHKDADTQNTDPHKKLNYLKIPVNPPYSKPQETQINDLWLPEKPYYTTADV